VYPSIVAKQRPSTNVTAATNTLGNRRTVGRAVLYAVRVVSKESRGLLIPRTSCLIVEKLNVIICHNNNNNNNNNVSSLELRNKFYFGEQDLCIRFEVLTPMSSSI
jgi:hypothetical protein